MPATQNESGWLYKAYRREIRPLFNLRLDLDEQGAIESIKKSVEFRGTNVWVLIFAIFIASVGLNVNSTAVIIGAMLISPLMGPIIGAGLALGINDFALLKKSLRNLIIATSVSVVTSTIYFFISPLGVAQSELLARTRPTIYDVLIAALGGAAGIIAATRQEKNSNVISGVAIATALMPPLCTVGYGLAHGQIMFSLGAFYLFFINSVFICLATFAGIRTIRFRKMNVENRSLERKASIYMTVFALAAVIPASYTGYMTIQEAVFQTRATAFMASAFNLPNTKVISEKITAHRLGGKIEVTLIGDALTTEERHSIELKLKDFQIKPESLVITEAGSSLTKGLEAKLREEIKASNGTSMYGIEQKLTASLNQKIETLTAELDAFRQFEKIVVEAGQELAAINPDVVSVSLGKVPNWKKSRDGFKELPIILVGWRKVPSHSQKQMIENFLKIKIKSDEPVALHYADAIQSQK